MIVHPINDVVESARVRKFDETIARVSKLKTPWLRDDLLASLHQEEQARQSDRRRNCN